MAEPKTKINDASVEEFIANVADENARKDCEIISEMMRKASGSEPKMWGTAIIGFGTYHFKYASGREGDWMRIGFSPRKQSLTLYIMNGFDRFEKLMAKLGKHKTGKSCLYIKRLSDIDIDVLKELIKLSVEHFEKKYGKN